MKVEFSLLAQADIDEIAGFIAEDNPLAAERIVNLLVNAGLEVAPFPRRFAVSEGPEEVGVRRRVMESYSLFFVIRSEDVLILRILHAGRDYARLLAQL